MVILMAISLVLPLNNTATAATIAELEAYGFSVPASGYSYRDWFAEANVITVKANNKIIGQAVTVAAMARSTTTDSYGYYYDIFLIRTQMEPKIASYAGSTTRGLNYKARARCTLGGVREYVNFAPKATMPESSSTWNVSFSGSASDKFGFTLGTGYSSTIKDNCYTVMTQCSSTDKSYDISYNYKPSAHIFSTAARKATNLWCTNTHQTYYAFTYRTKKGNYHNIKVYYDVSFKYALTGSSWNGSTYDVIPTEYKGSKSVLYVGSG